MMQGVKREMTISKIVVGVLTYNRPELLEETLHSFNEYLKAYRDLFKFVIFDNGSKDEIIKINKKIAQKYRSKFVTSRKVIESTKNSKIRDHNISIGHRNLSRLMKKEDGDAYIILEDDWACAAYIPLIELIEYLRKNPDIGQIRLRNSRYDGTLTGGAKHNFVTQEPIKWTKEVVIGNYILAYGNLHWVNNPSIISKEALDLISKGYNSEVECMKAFHEIYPINLQLQPGVFEHIGPWRHRKDLVEQGIIQGEDNNESFDFS
ncbi:glycosyltransferase family 2 protein [Alkalibaculum bacchi]|nr:glycosyltransferase [Alkalibaculum bacchi]